MAFRSWDRPMPGTIFRMIDDMSLQRGITYTILPDGRSLRVPAMARINVRAHADSHAEDDGQDMVRQLTRILEGKKPSRDRSRDQHGARGQRQGLREVLQAPQREGLQHMRVQGSLPGGGGISAL